MDMKVGAKVGLCYLILNSGLNVLYEHDFQVCTFKMTRSSTVFLCVRTDF